MTADDDSQWRRRCGLTLTLCALTCALLVLSAWTDARVGSASAFDTAVAVEVNAADGSASAPLRFSDLAPVASAPLNGSFQLRTFTNVREGGAVVAATTSTAFQQTNVDVCGAFPTVDTSAFASVVIEVGTNLFPETRKMSPFTAKYEDVAAMAKMWGAWQPARDRLRYFITVDPLVNATLACLALGKVHRVVEGAVTPGCGAISFFIDGTLSSVMTQKESGRVTETRVGTFPLSSLLASIQPATQRVQLLLVDAQGYDESVVMSGGEQLSRVDNVVLECQDLPYGHPKMLSPTAGTCANASAALQGLGFRFMFCMPNLATAEKNCWFYHPRFVKRNFTFPLVDVRGTSRRAEFPTTLLTMAGDVFKAMCVSFVRPIVFANLCAMANVMWGDPADITQPLVFDERCAFFSVVHALGPSNRRAHSQRNKMTANICHRSPTGRAVFTNTTLSKD